MQSILLAMERLPAVAVLRQSGILYTVVNGLHILGIGLLVGGIAVLDLRILRARDPGEWRSLVGSAAPVAATARMTRGTVRAAMGATAQRGGEER